MGYLPYQLVSRIFSINSMVCVFVFFVGSSWLSKTMFLSNVFGNDWSCYPPKQVGFIFQEVFSTGFVEGFHVIGLCMTIFKKFEVPSKCFAKLCHWVTWHDGQINVYRHNTSRGTLNLRTFYMVLSLNIDWMVDYCCFVWILGMSSTQ